MRREMTIGRSPYCSVVIAHPRVSRHHALVRLCAGRLEIEDSGSRNGTFVNGHRIRGARGLVVGDVIQIGPEPIEVQEVDTVAGRTDTVRRPPAPQEVGETTRSNVVDRLRALVTLAVETDQREAVLPLITHTIDATTRSVKEGAGPLRPDEAEAVAGIATMVSTWSKDAELEDWSRKVGATLV